MANKKASLQSPWVTLYNKICAMFERDSDISIEPIFQNADGIYEIRLSSDHTVKLKAIEKILKNEFEFGNVKVVVKFIYTATEDDTITTHDYEVAFSGNDIFSSIQTIENPWQINASYVIFSKEVIQFYNDDLTDIYGNYNGLAEDIARDIFKDSSLPIYFCTSEF